jgi:polysaccharide pyruvyl transferase WcaK-like protein
MRVLIDQSDYKLLNMGDVAMLQSCILRLSQQWPDAEMMIIARSAKDLAVYCPAALPVWRNSGQPLTRLLPARYQPIWQNLVPYLSGHIRLRQVQYSDPRTALQAVRASDVVVASGGGYFTDIWRWHATGVLGVLAMAQRLGKPTAMFGQGIGPIRQRMLQIQARAVLPRLALLGLREGCASPDLARSLGARPHAITVTGDDALEFVENSGTIVGQALGINMRVSSYAGIDAAQATNIGDMVAQVAMSLNAPLVGLPVSRHEIDTDVGAIHHLISRYPHENVIMPDINTPRDLITCIADCRTVITGSYHAALFGLAQGVPAVCLTKSSYYDGKFAGLKALFPESCSIVSIGLPNFADRLRNAIHQAWNLPDEMRMAARDAAMRQRDAGRAAYATFRTMVDKN